jgi:hypothetical protein
MSESRPFNNPANPLIVRRAVAVITISIYLYITRRLNRTLLSRVETDGERERERERAEPSFKSPPLRVHNARRTRSEL